jgi:3-vinyl bacteriochlorophyllide hydratase
LNWKPGGFADGLRSASVVLRDGPTQPATREFSPSPATRKGTEKQPYQLYTPEERARRDASPWTLVQGILAPVQFVVFLVSLALVLRYLFTGLGGDIAMWSVIIKTMILYLIMVTGSIWEKDVFGHYLFAGPFFWEDVVSMLVLALHTAYLIAVAFSIGSETSQMWLALAAYASYVVNAAQFVWKLRQARLQGQADTGAEAAAPAISGASMPGASLMEARQ